MIRNSIWLLFSEGFGKGISFLMTIIVARYLLVDDYGKFTFIFAYVTIFSFVADFGISTWIIREIAKNREIASSYISKLTTLKLLLAILTLIIVVLSAFLITKDMRMVGLIFLAGLQMVINSFSDFIRSCFRAYEKMQFETISRIVQGVLLFLSVGAAILLKMPIFYLILGYSISSLVSLIFNFILFHYNFVAIKLKLDKAFIKKTMVVVWPFAFSILLTQIYYQVDTVQVNLITNDYQTGIYSAAYAIIFALLSITMVAYNSSFPTFSRIYIQSKEKFYNSIHRASFFTIIFSFLICLAFFLASPLIINLIYGQDYLGSVAILRVLTISIFFLLVNTLYSQAILIMNHQREYFNTVFIGVLLNFLLNFLTIYYFQALGAALTTLLTSIIITIMFITKFKTLRKKDLETI